MPCHIPQSVGGIILPETQAKKNEGEVVAVGPGALLKDGSRAPISVEVGAKVRHRAALCQRMRWRWAVLRANTPARLRPEWLQVLLPEYGGTKVDLGADGDDEFVLYRDDDILGTFER